MSLLGSTIVLVVGILLLKLFLRMHEYIYLSFGIFTMIYISFLFFPSFFLNREKISTGRRRKKLCMESTNMEDFQVIKYMYVCMCMYVYVGISFTHAECIDVYICMYVYE